MSIATTKRDNQPIRRERVSMRLDARRMIEKTSKAIRRDLYGSLAFMAIAITGIGLLIGREFSFAWYGLTTLLLGAAFYREYFPPAQLEIHGIDTQFKE